MSWRLSRDGDGVALYDDETRARVRLEGVATIDVRVDRDGSTVTLHPLRGMERQAHEAACELMRQLPASYPVLRVEVAGPQMVAFVGGPLDGQTRPLPSSTRHATYVHAEARAGFRDVGGRVALAADPYVLHHYQLFRLADGGWAYVHPDAMREARRREQMLDVERRPAFNPQGWRECAACEVRWTGGVHCWSCGDVGDESYAPHVGEVGY